jgi:phospholipid/cholesterol/gamma-HCH transport system substrate-binding protein
MDSNKSKFKIRLGLFIGGGVVLFLLAIFLIGKQKNLFNPVFKLTAAFYNVSGLQVGNNVRFSGINVGTVNSIDIINDSTVMVEMLIKTSVKKFIRSDCTISIGSEGLIGDRLLIISQGNPASPLVVDKQQLLSNEPVETDAIMSSLEVTAGNAEIISRELAEIMVKVNSGNGTLGRLIQDSAIAENFNQTLVNLKNSSKGLNENMEAAKHNFLFKGYFNKKEKDAKKKKIDDAKLLEQKNIQKKEIK